MKLTASNFQSRKELKYMSESSELLRGAGAGIALAFGGKDLMVKFLGPTADYFGGELKGLSENGFTNIKRILSNGLKKVGADIEKVGSIAPKVVHQILEEGYFCEDEVSAEYFGGVLASSRVSDLRDDRGAYWVGVLSRMSSYQIRSHYLAYSGLRNYQGKDVIANILQHKKGTVLHAHQFRAALEFPNNEDASDFIEHVGAGLKREQLARVFEIYKTDPSYIYFEPTWNGVYLFLWAFGKGREDRETYSSSVHEFEIPGISPIEIAPTNIQREKGIGVWG